MLLFLAAGQKKTGRGQDSAKKEFLKPNVKDTPRRASPLHGALEQTTPTKSSPSGGFSSFSNMDVDDPFPATFQGSNFFKTPAEDKSTGSGHSFFTQSGNKKKETAFDPRKHKATSGV